VRVIWQELKADPLAWALLAAMCTGIIVFCYFLAKGG
jgi:hypothetical protein